MRAPCESDYKRVILVLMSRMRLKKVDMTFEDLDAINPETRMVWTTWPQDRGVTLELKPAIVTIEGEATEVRAQEQLA